MPHLIEAFPSRPLSVPGEESEARKVISLAFQHQNPSLTVDTTTAQGLLDSQSFVFAEETDHKGLLIAGLGARTANQMESADLNKKHNVVRAGPIFVPPEYRRKLEAVLIARLALSVRGQIVYLALEGQQGEETRQLGQALSRDAARFLGPFTEGGHRFERWSADAESILSAPAIESALRDCLGQFGLVLSDPEEHPL